MNELPWNKAERKGFRDERRRLGLVFVLLVLWFSQPGSVFDLPRLLGERVDTSTPEEFICLRQALPEEAVILFFGRADGAIGSAGQAMMRTRYYLAPQLVTAKISTAPVHVQRQYEWFVTLPKELGPDYLQVLQSLGLGIIRDCEPFLVLKRLH